MDTSDFFFFKLCFKRLFFFFFTLEVALLPLSLTLIQAALRAMSLSHNV